MVPLVPKAEAGNESNIGRKMMPKRLYKIERGRKIFGVCGGLAEYFNIDVSLVRIAWVLLVLFGGTGILLYLVCAIVLPNKSDVEY
jgi:Putative stress-responsive transcriptional regulator